MFDLFKEAWRQSKDDLLIAEFQDIMQRYEELPEEHQLMALNYLGRAYQWILGQYQDLRLLSRTGRKNLQKEVKAKSKELWTMNQAAGIGLGILVVHLGSSLSETPTAKGIAQITGGLMDKALKMVQSP